MDTSEARDDGGSAADLLRSLRPPAIVRDRHFDVIAANTAATRLSTALRPGQNLLRRVFLPDQDDEECILDDSLPESAVALLRDSLEEHEEDTRFAALVGELSARSIRFSELWANASTAVTTNTVAVMGSHAPLRFFEHRPVGEYEMTVVVFEQSS
jgi:hypothetical protein